MKRRRIIRLCCSIMLMGVLGIGQLFGGSMQVSLNRPPVQLKRISKHISYPGIQGAPIVQEFYLWVEVSKKMQRSMKKQSWRIEFDSFYWSGYRGLGSFGAYGAEVKSMRISSPTNEWRYWKDRFAIDSAKSNWILVVGTVEIPTRNEYDFPVSEGSVISKNKRVPWESGDPELVVYYCIERWESGGFQKVSQSQIRVDKISRTTAVFHP